MLAAGTPAEIRQLGVAPDKTQPTIEDAFIRVVMDEQKAVPNAGAA